MSVQVGDTLVQKMAELGRKDLFFFCKGILRYDKLDPEIHGPICERLQDLSIKRVNQTMPRNFFKTTVGTIGYGCWRPTLDPNVTILIAMNKMDNAAGKLREVRQQYEHNPILRACYPEIIPDFAHTTWGDRGASVRRTAVSGTPTWTPTGAGGDVISGHWDEIIMDDLATATRDRFSDEDILPSTEDVAKAIGWYRQSVSLLKDPRQGRIMNIGTRWGLKDLVEFILRTSDDFRAHSWELKALDSPEGHPIESFTDAAGLRRFRLRGMPTFPAMYPIEVLESILAQTGSTIFSLWYLNEPVDPSELVFALDDGHFYDQAALAAKLDALPHYTAVDLAISDKAGADNTAVVTVAVDAENNRYVRDVRYGRLNPMETIDVLFGVYERYKPRVIGIESVAYQAFLPRVLPHFMKEKDVYLPLRELPRGGAVSKASRIRVLQPFLQARKLFLARGACRALEVEMRDYREDDRRSGHDDALDALADAVRLSERPSAPVAVKKRERITPEEWAKIERDLASVDIAVAEAIKQPEPEAGYASDGHWAYREKRTHGTRNRLN